MFINCLIYPQFSLLGCEEDQPCILASIFAGILWILYIVSSKKLKSFAFIIDNYISVSAISLIGIVLYIISYKTELSKYFIDIFVLYMIPVALVFLIFYSSLFELVNDYPNIIILYTFIPSILSWIGLQFINKRDTDNR